MSTMSVLTIVRALPQLSLWKRRTIKGKSPELEIENILPADSSDNQMHRDVYVHIAVKDDSDSIPHSTASSSQILPTRAQLDRAVSWANIVHSQDRWTASQEKELIHAQKQLEKCQKAWSSEQEIWLAYVQALSEEKEAHTGFLSARHRQQGDEQHQFRKAWKRRRSSGDEMLDATEMENRLGKLRRLQRYGYSGQRLGAGSTALAVKG